VAGERQLAAAAERVAVDRGDHRLERALELQHHSLAKARDLLGGGRAEHRQLVDVGARDEALVPATGDDQRAQLGIRVKLASEIVDLGQRLAVERVEHGGPVDAQHRDRTDALDLEIGVGHRGRGHRKVLCA